MVGVLETSQQVSSPQSWQSFLNLSGEDWRTFSFSWTVSVTHEHESDEHDLIYLVERKQVMEETTQREGHRYCPRSSLSSLN